MERAPQIIASIQFSFPIRRLIQIQLILSVKACNELNRFLIQRIYMEDGSSMLMIYRHLVGYTYSEIALTMKGSGNAQP